jgi:elongation factor Ts
MSIAATQVKELRERTGAGMMDCKHVLTEAGGDMDKAIELFRTRGMAKAAKKAGREMGQGIVSSYIHPGGGVGVLVEVSCETDFVARAIEEGKPQEIAEKMVEGRLKKFRKENALLEQPFVKNPDLTIEQLVQSKIASLGENMRIKRFARFSITG